MIIKSRGGLLPPHVLAVGRNSLPTAKKGGIIYRPLCFVKMLKEKDIKGPTIS